MMGTIYEDHGPNSIAIEGRSQSFIIHAGYGYRSQKKAIRELSLGTKFIHPGRGGSICQLVTLDLNGPASFELVDGDGAGARGFIDPALEVIWCYDESDRPNTEDVIETSAGEQWRKYQPEFELADLDHLIEALTEYKEKIG